jgi:Xaa-Pro dipeptidase
MKRIPGNKVSLYVHPDSHAPMRSLDEQGRRRHRILEIHFVDRELKIGAFYEKLLTVDSSSALTARYFKVLILD